MLRRLSAACLAALLLALTGTPVFAKPPDLPQDSKIVVSPHSPVEQESLPVEPAVPESGEWRSFREGLQQTGEDPDPWTAALREMLASSLFLEAHPFVAFWGQTGKQPSTPATAPPEATSPCPYLREKAQNQETRVLNPVVIRSVMDNLRALEQAAEQVRQARQLAADGHYLEALDCLQKVRELCPGSSYETQIEQMYNEFISGADAQMDQGAEGAEESEPEGCGCCCGCFCGWLAQFGMCWMESAMSYLAGMGCPFQAYTSDSNKPVVEKFETFDDLLAIQREWERLGLPGHPTHLAPGHMHGGIQRESSQSEDKQDDSEEGSENVSSPRMCGSVCPKCEALHAQYMKKAGVAEQVTGLMKACYLALGEGRVEKAAELARQAYALDPARVQGDPIVYKMHLLAEQSNPASPAKHELP
jgi:hypothetical protein